MHPHPLDLGCGQGLPACAQSRCLQVPGHPQELGHIPTPRGCPGEPLPPPPSRRVYKALIPSYKRRAPCQGSNGTCCHSRGWKARSCQRLRLSCQLLGAGNRWRDGTPDREQTFQGRRGRKSLHAAGPAPFPGHAITTVEPTRPPLPLVPMPQDEVFTPG